MPFSLLFVFLHLLAAGPDLNQTLVSIENALQAGDLATASRLIDDSMQHHSNVGELLNLRGVLHAQQHDVPDARRDFTTAVRLSPGLTPAWQNLARACQMQAQEDPSAVSCTVDAWERVLRLKPGDKEALTSLKQMLEQVALADPKNPAHLLELARLADTSKDYTGALGYLAHARDLAPDNAQIHFLFAEVAMEMHLVVQARASLDQALKLDPNNPAYNYAMGFVILQTRHAATAAGYFQKFVAANPGNPKGHYALGIAYYASGDFANSKTEMHRVEHDSTTVGGAEYFLGRMARQEGNLDAAEAHLRKSIQLLPDFAESHTELARICMSRKNLREAERELDQAVRLDPQSFEANMQLLVVYRRTHDARAAQQAELVKKLDGDRSRRAELALRTVEARPVTSSTEADRFVSAMALVKSGDDEKARAILADLSAEHPEKALYIYWLGRLDYDQRRYQEAVAKLRKAAELDPNSARIQDSLGNALDMQGLTDEALAAFQHSAELNHNLTHPSPWPPHDLGYLLLRMEKFQPAAAALRESLRYDPKLAQTHWYLGRTLEKQGEDAEAIEQYKQAVSADPASPDACYSLAMLYRNLHRESEAQAMFTEYKRRKQLHP
ncbi:MAG TPA: tetratricopeptide repeat protein [Bryobacteraceae bacterium]|nr:tetratricopeptide repeat protein [Bryobacteraceae bacterium]